MNKLFLPVVFLPTCGKQTDVEKKIKTKTKKSLLPNNLCNRSHSLYQQEFLNKSFVW